MQGGCRRPAADAERPAGVHAFAREQRVLGGTVGEGLRQVRHISNCNKLTSVYAKCMKLFFGIPKYGSVSAMLMQLNLPSFNSVLHNARVAFQSRLKLSGGAVMNAIRLVGCII